MSGTQIIKLMSSDNAEISVGKSKAPIAAAAIGITLLPANMCPTEREVAERSILIKNMMEDIGDQTIGEAIPIPNVRRFCVDPISSYDTDIGWQVNEAVLNKVIEWCTHHRADPPAVNDDDSDSRKKTTDIDEWDQKFMQVDQEMLFEIILVSKHILKYFS